MYKIIIATHGFVFAGLLNDSTITEGFVVRKWGTTQGLGELAAKGPLADTILDPLPRTYLLKEQIIAVLDCSEEWTVDKLTAYQVIKAMK